VQAIPLVGAAAIGHLIFGNLVFGLTSSVLVGAIPGVYFGARVSARANDRFIRPLLVAVLSISALKLLNAPNGLLLGWSVVAVVVLAGVLIRARIRNRPVRPPEPVLTS
jgi:hypothetical protein